MFRLQERILGQAPSAASGDIDFMKVHQWLETASGGESTFPNFQPENETWLGTASLLLDGDFQEAEPLVILEGAPGQGKSTIAQYICQVHRMRILGAEGRDAVDPVHLASSLRLPFKVELRAFATWLAGGNPFGTATGDNSQEASPSSL